MNLQESIIRILRENDYSPAGKEVMPNSIVVHKSNPMFREEILKNGLKVKTGECYTIYVGYGTKCKPAIFATNSTKKRAWFDSTYDDDIWEINTEMIPDVKWYKDRHYESRSKHIVTFQDIPKEAITLKYKGTGSGDHETWSKDSPNLVESIRRILREETESRMVNVMQDSIDKVGITSTIMIFGGFKVFKNYLDKLTFTYKDKIDFIKYVLNELGGLSLSELGWQPIPYGNDGNEYKEIVYLGTQRAIIDVWGGHNYETHQGEFGVHYYNLNDDILDDIFYKLLTVANENDLI